MKRKKKMPDEAYNADFPARQNAIRIIEGVIEPLLDRIKHQHDKKWELSGEPYYELEDEITRIIGNYDL